MVLPVLAGGAAGDGLDVFCAYDVYCEDGLGLKEVPAPSTFRITVAQTALTSSP